MSLKNFENRTIIFRHQFIEMSFWSDDDRDSYLLSFDNKLDFIFDVVDQPKLCVWRYFEPGLYHVRLTILWFSLSILINL